MFANMCSWCGGLLQHNSVANPRLGAFVQSISSLLAELERLQAAVRSAEESGVMSAERLFTAQVGGSLVCCVFCSVSFQLTVLILSCVGTV